MFGKKHTPEVRKRLSEMMTGHSFNKGIKLKLEHIEKIRARQKLRIGNKNSFYGKKHKPETIKKLRKINLGKTAVNRKVITDGRLIFTSCREAARYFKISEGLVTYRLHSNKYPNWSYINKT